jgi:predicted amidohydrolase
MTCYVRETKSLAEETDRSAELLTEFMAFARANQCYMICPIYTHENGHIYNSAVVIDRQGNRVGEYRKMHLPEGEIKLGITPGPLQPPVFKTDFGTIGIQICFDINWDTGWKALQQQGAEIVFWPSAYGGGQVISSKAWQNRYVVVSSVNKETAKICDISGEVVAKTGFWDNNLICGAVNLEKVFLFTWPNSRRFDDIRAKYGRKINITTYHEEEWTIIESLSPDVYVKDVLAEFEIRSARQMILEGEMANDRLRI